MVSALGCSVEPESELGPELATDPEPEPVIAPRNAACWSGDLIDFGDLPVLDPLESTVTFIEQLPVPTVQGENVAVHMKLPPPHDPVLIDSLVRVIGDGEASLLAFRTSALVQLGVVAQSPGPEFFTAFLTLDPTEIDERVQAETTLAGMGNSTNTVLVFEGRTPIALSSAMPFDSATFLAGGLVPLGRCPLKPASEFARWEESLMIIDPAVVEDPTRTHACGVPGNPNGVWTFKHLMEEMALQSGYSTHDFVVEWLEQWLNDDTLNGDTVVARTQMFNEVIVPWADASNVLAVLSGDEHKTITLIGGDLDLDEAPFHLAAIVNRIDLGRTRAGGGGYSGGVTSQPVDAGELRFVFGVDDAMTCERKPFTVIFEYGVPIKGCLGVRQWARDWVALNDPALPRFSAVWRAHLESLTESVVVSGAAPWRGNESAINQIRTNEIALDCPWEMREFTLTTEDLDSTNTVPPGTPDTPVPGLLQRHTVAMTPDDDPTRPAFWEVDDFVNNVVFPPIGSGVPGDCSASYVVPADYPTVGDDFRGANALIDPPTHWVAPTIPATPDGKCARHQFSLNTCNGCHACDTATDFMHVDPTNPPSTPATLSGFLTGGSPPGSPPSMWSVPDTQFGTPTWNFADLNRRYHRLYQLACTSCGSRLRFFPFAFQMIFDIAGVLPIDSIGPGVPPFPVGPIVDLGVVSQLLTARGELLDPTAPSSVEVDGLVHEVDAFVH